jgi:hypothetical protein
VSKFNNFVSFSSRRFEPERRLSSANESFNHHLSPSHKPRYRWHTALDQNPHNILRRCRRAGLLSHFHDAVQYIAVVYTHQLLNAHALFESVADLKSSASTASTPAAHEILTSEPRQFWIIYLLCLRWAKIQRKTRPFRVIWVARGDMIKLLNDTSTQTDIGWWLHFSDAILSYVYRVDAEKYLGLPSLIDVYGHDAVNIKERFPTLRIFFNSFRPLNWVLDSACAFSFALTGQSISSPIFSPLVHLRSFWNRASPFHLGNRALSAHLDYSTNNLNNTI